MGLFKRVRKSVRRGLKASWKINKGVFGGGYVKKAVKGGVSYGKKHPELVAAAGAAFGVPLLGSAAGLFGGSGSGDYGPAPVPDDSATVPDDSAEPPDNTKTLLLIGGEILLLLLLTRRK